MSGLNVSFVSVALLGVVAIGTFAIPRQVGATGVQAQGAGSGNSCRGGTASDCRMMLHAADTLAHMFVSGDPAPVFRYFDDAASIVLSDGHRQSSAEMIREIINSPHAESAGFDGASVDIYGGTANVRWCEHFTPRSGDEALHDCGTDTWLKHDDIWKIIASQETRISSGVSTLVSTDPPRINDHPASLVSVVIASGNGALNAVLYKAAGARLHPTLILFHGFPGNEQNLDLAQAARRAGWNVLTLHYRGTWGSPGDFSFVHCIEDAHAALAYLRDPSHAVPLGVDAGRVAVAGHSMGGMIAARLAADDRSVLGAFLIDPWDVAHEASEIADPESLLAFQRDELDGDMPPLNGVTEQGIIEQIRKADGSLDLARTIPDLADRPLSIVYAEFGMGKADEQRIGSIVRSHQPRDFEDRLWSTDHSFSDKRIVLAKTLLSWLAKFDGRHEDGNQ